MTPTKLIHEWRRGRASITKNLVHIANKTARGAKLTEKHKRQLEKAMIKLYTAASDLDKIALVLE